MINAEMVGKALEGVLDPELGRNLVELGMVREIEVRDARVEITLALTSLACPLKGQIVEDAKQAVLDLDGSGEVQIGFVEMTLEEKQRLKPGDGGPKGVGHLNEIQHVVAVMSGKGGVGKSLISALLAAALRRAGRTVGVLDADITGPSIPKMLLPEGTRPETSPLGLLPAQTESGIMVMSINLLLEEEDQAVIWRGPLIGRAIQQFWSDVLWGKVDYLVVDLPPGTSDASLTVMQALPLSGVVLVTSPQDLAGMVVRKAARMAGAMAVPILGLIENMAYFACPETGKHHNVFGPSHADETAAALRVPLLGRLPIDPEIARLCDQGKIEQFGAVLFQPVVEQIIKVAGKARAPAIKPS